MAVQIFLDAIPAKRERSRTRGLHPPALQSVRRDFLAFLAPTSLTAAELVRAIRDADKTKHRRCRLFDRFTGQGVPEGREQASAVEVGATAGEELHRRRVESG